MDSIQSVQLLVAINLIVIGLSHFLQPGIWVTFFQFLSKKGVVGNIFNALLSLGFGSFIVAFHWWWKWPMVLVTIYGCLQLLKGTIYLLLPSIGLKSIAKVDEKSLKFRWVGIVMILLGLYIFYEWMFDF